MTSGRSEYPVTIDKKALQEIANKPVQLPINTLDLDQKTLRTLIHIKALEEYLQEHACIPDFVVNLDE